MDLTFGTTIYFCISSSYYRTQYASLEVAVNTFSFLPQEFIGPRVLVVAVGLTMFCRAVINSHVCAYDLLLEFHPAMISFFGVFWWFSHFLYNIYLFMHVQGMPQSVFFTSGQKIHNQNIGFDKQLVRESHGL
jgi:hypothetical protein